MPPNQLDSQELDYFRHETPHKDAATTVYGKFCVRCGAFEPCVSPTDSPPEGWKHVDSPWGNAFVCPACSEASGYPDAIDD